MAKYAYYPGCSLGSSAIEYDLSTKAMMTRMGHDLEELDGWICCGTSPAHQTNAALSADLAAFNIMLASAKGLDIVVPCAACFSRLKAGIHKLENNASFRAKVEKKMGQVYKPVKIISPIEVAAGEDGLNFLSANALEGAANIKVVPYYGCLLVRPPKITGFDDPENPVLMDSVLKAAGFEVLEWEYKTECCGGSLSISHRDSALRLSHRILRASVAAGADGIAVACPLCQQNLDARQFQVNERYREKFNIPIYYFTELLGIALGMDPDDMKMGKHIVDALATVKKVRQGS